MKIKTVQTILTAAKEKQQRIVIKMHNDSITFNFAKGDTGENDIIEYDNKSTFYSK